ncbi:MAG TPA: family 43 glycosylhydrolase, partial [Candidatus Hydrogenedentes bacterium]|nr:family 43 glycosylhydrolase [Candidatus Hydrogenedentota bacterium]
ILVADNPQGPYRVHGDGPVTPPDWDCLDGTLFIGEDKQPWIVFCHEWTQTRDGEICARKLSPDLSKAEGDPILLFRASAAPWVVEVGFGGPRKGFVTDGPFLHRTKEGALLMLWSSFSQKGYVQSYAYSESGHLSGPWVQQKIPWFDEDAGHGMLFRCFDGRQMLVLHRPNGGGRERAHLFEIGESPHELISTPFRF